MNHCGVQRQNAVGACEEMMKKKKRDSFPLPVSSPDRRDPLICPKPRRVSALNSAINNPVRPLRWHFSHQADLCDSKAGADLLDIILSKGGGGYGGEHMCAQIASSPPFFSGSPPSRSANPVIHDSRFRDDKLLSVPPSTAISSSPVRIEGFDCLNGDNRRNCTISALA